MDRGEPSMRALGFDRADDGQIWEYAKAHGLVLVSQGADFAERSRLRGAPPKLIWLRCGNTTTKEVERLLRQDLNLLLELERNPKLEVLEIS